MNKREIIDFYLSLGFSVIPLLPSTKIPSLVSWAEYQRRKPTQEEINIWFGDDTKNFGIVCGKVSKNLVVLDFDKPDMLKKAEREDLLKKTLCVKTKKGIHVYLQSNVTVPSAKREYGLDIKSEGGYIVGAGSEHPDGGTYEFANNIKEIMVVDNIEEILTSIDQKFSFIKQPVEDLKQQVAKDLMGVSSGARNNAAIRVADFYIHHLQWSPEQTNDFLIKYWNIKNDPPMPEREIRACVNSAKQRPYWSKKLSKGEVPVQSYGGPFLLAKYVLGQTIKSDDNNKLLTFLGELSTYTLDSQLNILYKADSATGKSHIALKVADLFPRGKEGDVIELAGASATSFFHEFSKHMCKEHPEWDNRLSPKCSMCTEKNVDFNNKILIFLDQPDDQLLDRLKPLLSHDRKELVYKITDKLKSGTLRTKTVVLKGWPSVVFCTARLSIQEEQSTRSFILSPEEDQDKLNNSLDYMTDQAKKTPTQIKKELEEDPGRIALKQYILGLRDLKCPIVIPEADKVLERFRSTRDRLTARHQRDYKRLLSLIKVVTFFNKADRIMEKDANNEDVLYATHYDIELAFSLFDPISESNEMGLSPSVFDFYKLVLYPLWDQNPILDFRQIQSQFMALYRKPLNTRKLREVILPPLEATGLLYVDKAPIGDRRTLCVYKQKQNGKLNTQTPGAPTPSKLGIQGTPTLPAYSWDRFDPEDMLLEYIKVSKTEPEIFEHMAAHGVQRKIAEGILKKLYTEGTIHNPKGGVWKK